MPFSASHTRHVRLRGRIFYLFLRGASSSEDESSSRNRFRILSVDMVLVVDAEGETRLDRIGEYLVAGGVMV